ncbi:MAG TPA: glycoside hydrolase family 97 N-terminal domain-containing protein [Puia sp.]
MKLFIQFIVFINISVHSYAFGPTPLRLLSPDKKITFEFEIRHGKPGYNIFYEKNRLINFSVLNLVFKGDAEGNSFRLEKSVTLDSSERYTLMTGRSASINDSFRQVSLFLKELSESKREYILEVRAFNDGIAFRYRFPNTGEDSLRIVDEKDEFNIMGNPAVHALIQDGFENAHEGNYLHRLLRNLPEDSLIDMPVLFSYSDSLYLAITEAALLDFAGMYIIKTKSGLVSKLSPNPSRPGYAVIAALPHVSPWRVLLISHRAGRFLETNMLSDLAPPNRIGDAGWLKPGKTTFPWWNGNVTADTLNAPGNNFVTQQYYIDFCARNKIDYHSVVEYGLHQWYQDDGISFMPGPHSNVLKPMPGLDMKQICDYAHSKGVGVRVWVHWKALYPKLDSFCII